jgi:hypothetical protein
MPLSQQIHYWLARSGSLNSDLACQYSSKTLLLHKWQQQVASYLSYQ